MTAPVCWVVGAGGMLGTALCREASRQGCKVWAPQMRFAWSEADTLARQLSAAVEDFAGRLEAGGEWRILWAAGTGAMGSNETQMRTETEAIARVLEGLQAQPRLVASRGALLLASSAGAIYAASTDPTITEHSAVAPTTPYARAKLEQEQLVARFAAAHPNTAVLIARLSTLYGPGQPSDKPQGIISHIARRTVRNQPIQIYVPYDTIRDYLYVDDAAAMCLQALDGARARGGSTTKIIASQLPTTIAEIISIFKRLTRRSPRIVTSASALSRLYMRRVVFRSVVQTEVRSLPPTPLMLGIADVLRAERSSLARGAAPARAVART